MVDRIRRTFARIHQSAELGKLPDRRGIVSDTACSQARLCWAAQCIEMHLGAYVYSHGEYIVYVTYMHALHYKKNDLTGKQRDSVQQAAACIAADASRHFENAVWSAECAGQQ